MSLLMVIKVEAGVVVDLEEVDVLVAVAVVVEASHLVKYAIGTIIMHPYVIIVTVHLHKAMVMATD
ncbi:hypothetical protein A2U01_0098850, partial [Trifolium medium]|nr:hypothetical protein [Trifolium medium]